MLWITAFAAFLLSLLSAEAADRFLRSPLPLLGTLLGLERTLNAGIAFSIRFPSFVQIILLLCGIVGVSLLAWQSASHQCSKAAFGGIIGGALANIVDRLRDGFVTDFFVLRWFPFVFNTADVCITVGVAILLVEGIGKRARKGEASEVLREDRGYPMLPK